MAHILWHENLVECYSIKLMSLVICGITIAVCANACEENCNIDLGPCLVRCNNDLECIRECVRENDYCNELCQDTGQKIISSCNNLE